MATAGLTGIVQLWDVRKIPTSSSKAKPKPVSWQEAGGRSINSAYFSPSGRRLLTTTMSNRLEIIEDSHLATGKLTTKVSVNHDNQTGRWLSTFMARWHPGCYDNRELFVVGCMKQPRCMEVYDHDGDLLREIRGDAITAVASRCCFHPDPNRLVVIGGNGSGRVTIAR
jgi:WD40 repeat protein